MIISDTQTSRSALIPSTAETSSIDTGNSTEHAMFKEIKHFRNGLYFSCALTVIAAMGALSLKSEIVRQYCIDVATMGAVLAAIAVKLKADTLFLQWANPRKTLATT